MKKLILNPTVWLSMAMLAFSALVFTSCDNDEDPKLPPTVTTATPTDVTPSSATVGGEIVSDGGEIITAAGVCYSATNATPTIADDSTKTAVLTGKFTKSLKNLASNTKYYVRAYAKNSVDVSYGEVTSFTTGNEAPTVTNIVINGITGDIKGDLEIDVTYEYKDKEGDKESGTTIQWYRADNFAGANRIAIDGATTKNYRISDADQGKVIWVGITPKTTTGTLVGAEANSDKKGPVGEATTVTFMYNGSEVTYGIINSSVTGRSWLDRNLGAVNVPAAYDDYSNFGDLFQWGRATDGHQLINRASSDEETTSVNDISNILATSDTPDNGKFITPSAAPFDWRSTPNNNLWQGVNGTNNPCPKGWRIPTIDEWTKETFTKDDNNNFKQLKLTYTGYRVSDGTFSGMTFSAYYWSSTTAIVGAAQRNVSKVLLISAGNDPLVQNGLRGNGMACRCIKDDVQ